MRTPASICMSGPSGASIARITLTGLIPAIRSGWRRGPASPLACQGRDRAYQQPGGTTAGSEELHRSLLALKSKKPMVVVVGGLAARAPNIAAIAADHIVAQETSLVGSIGVLFSFPM